MRPRTLSVVERGAVMRMLAAGVPVLTAPPVTDWVAGNEFQFTSWHAAVVRQDVLDRWRPGWMLAAKTGIAFDVIDVDPRHGGDVTLESLRPVLPTVAGVVVTPGGGLHLYVAATGAGLVHRSGIDYQGVGGLIYLPGCTRPKYRGAGYSWTAPIDWSALHCVDDSFPATLRKARPTADLVQRQRSPRPGAGVTQRRGSRYGQAALRSEADAVGRERDARNNRLNIAAFRCGQLAAEGHLHREAIVDALMDAADECGLLADDGADKCRATINSGFRAGTDNPRAPDRDEHA